MQFEIRKSFIANTRIKVVTNSEESRYKNAASV